MPEIDRRLLSAGKKIADEKIIRTGKKPEGKRMIAISWTIKTHLNARTLVDLSSKKWGIIKSNSNNIHEMAIGKIPEIIQ